MKKNQVTWETVFFYIGILGMIAAAGAAAIVRQKGIHLSGQLLPCMLYTLTGIPCPGCGGTRAVDYLFQGRILDSLLAHPLVIYMVLFYLYFLGSYGYEKFLKKRVFSIWHLAAFRELLVGGGVLLVLQWMAKLVLWTNTGKLC